MKVREKRKGKEANKNKQLLIILRNWGKFEIF